ncbi:hypothetical protein EXIGLDRAFT_784396, partial [Exidia glandulosa HHB12029]
MSSAAQESVAGAQSVSQGLEECARALDAAVRVCNNASDLQFRNNQTASYFVQVQRLHDLALATRSSDVHFDWLPGATAVIQDFLSAARARSQPNCSNESMTTYEERRTAFESTMFVLSDRVHRAMGALTGPLSVTDPDVDELEVDETSDEFTSDEDEDEFTSDEDEDEDMGLVPRVTAADQSCNISFDPTDRTAANKVFSSFLSCVECEAKNRICKWPTPGDKCAACQRKPDKCLIIVNEHPVRVVDFIAAKIPQSMIQRQRRAQTMRKEHDAGGTPAGNTVAVSASPTAALAPPPVAAPRLDPALISLESFGHAPPGSGMEVIDLTMDDDEELDQSNTSRWD